MKTETESLSPDEVYIHKPASWFETLPFEKVFPQNPNGPVHVDIGAGDGGFIRQRAKNHPGTNFIAVERLLGRARKISRRSYHEGIHNVRVLRIEATYSVEYLFPKKSIHSMTVLFPDPWPKRRHHKNRLIQTSFLKACHDCLRPEGWLAIKTDDENYFEHIKTCAEESKSFFETWKSAKSEDVLPELTDFEKEFLAAKKKINFLALKPK